MKKLIIIVSLLMPLAFVSNAQKTAAKKIQVIDQAVNPVRHWRIYSFEMVDRQATNIKQLKLSLAAVKGVQKVEPHDNTEVSARVLIYVDENMILNKSVELKNAFTTAGFDLVNIPVETK
jgi:hypothetical protein